MRTLGEYFRVARQALGISMHQVEQRTKIKKEFVRAIEQQDWEKLPEYPVLFGFVNNLARFYDLNESSAIALLRRDYPPNKLPKADLKPIPKKEFKWSPKFTFALGVGFVVLLVAGYLLFQYRQFLQPPPLEVIEPTQDQVVTKPEIRILGKTTRDVTITANNQPIIVDDQGVFESNLAVSQETQSIEIQAISRSGKMSKVSRRIDVQLP